MGLDATELMDLVTELYAVKPDDQMMQVLVKVVAALGFEQGQVSAVQGEMYIPVLALPPVENNTTYRLETVLCRMSLKTRQIWVLTDDFTESHPYQSYVGIPLMVNGKEYGTLHFANREQRNPHDLTAAPLQKFFKIIGYITSSAIERSWGATRRNAINKIFSSAPNISRVGHWEWDIATNQTIWSDEIFHMLGHDPNTFVPDYQSLLQMMEPEDRMHFEREVAASLEQKRGYELLEFRLITATGEVRTLATVGYPKLNESGQMIGLFGMIQDVTERKQSEEDRRKSEAALKAAQEIGEMGHWQWDIATNKVEWSDQHYILQGYEIGSIEPTYEVWLNSIAPEDRARMHQVVMDAVANNGGYEAEYMVEFPNGERRAQYAKSFARFDHTGKMIGMFGIGQDITKRKQMENTIRERTRDLEMAVEVSKQISRILEADELLSNLVEHTRASFNFYHVAVFIAHEDALIYQDGTGEVARSIKAEGKQFLLSETEGGLVARAGYTRQPVLENNVRLLADFVANPYLPETQSELALPMLIGDRLIGVLDLQATEVNRFQENEVRVLVLLAEQLAIAIENAQLYAQQEKVAEELRRVDKLKSEFLANMSHELRTPLNAILNFTSFVAKEVYGPVNQEQADNLRKVINSATHLLGLINDILDLSKIEAGMMNLFIEDTNLNLLLDNVIATAGGLPRAESTSFIVEVSKDLPVMRVDKRRIRQILLNLLSNAFKFTREGSVTLRAVCEDGFIICTVSDTGTGISEQDLDLIFQPFRQAAVGAAKGGTGLGLPISRYFAEAHGGRLWVESEMGVGTTFYFSLPM